MGREGVERRAVVKEGFGMQLDLFSGSGAVDIPRMLKTTQSYMHARMVPCLCTGRAQSPDAREHNMQPFFSTPQHNSDERYQ
jgi:hypothetical protein